MRMKLLITGALLLPVALPLRAQEMAGGQERTESNAQSTRMIMATDDAKAFRLIRPVIAAVQVKLADLDLFAGRISGLYGPSTRDAVFAYQTKLGHEATGLPTLRTALSLLDIDAAAAANTYGDRIDTKSQMSSGTMDHMQMPMPMPMPMMDHEMAGSPAGELTGDPSSAKSLMLMDMPGMKMDDRHTRAVRAVRELIAGVQIQLAEHQAYSGMIDGLPESEATKRALEAFQAQASLMQTGSLDFLTAMRLFGLDPAEVSRKYAGRIAVSESPVAMDDELLRASASRFGSLFDAERPARVESEGNSADTARIEVTLMEFSFAPDTIRIPAGSPVTLVIKNTGLIPHEFMAGRNAREGDFEDDLFAGVHVNMTMGEMVMRGGDEEEHGHGGDAHGTMVTADAGKTVYMSFTLPESRSGVWSMACFLPGHYQAGMRGTLVVY